MVYSNLKMQANFFSTLLVCFFIVNSLMSCNPLTQANEIKTARRTIRSTMHARMHSHMSKKIIERACQASPEVLEHVFNCMKDNKSFQLHMNVASTCFKEAYDVDFDVKNLKNNVCGKDNKEKIDDFLGCGFREVEKLDLKDTEHVSEHIIDTGMCIINSFGETVSK